MEINHLREFIILAETGNFMEAADYLFVSQSALSKHIKKLEAELGAPLFDRSTRKVELNEYGRMFLPYANQIAQLQYDYTAAFNNKLKTDNDTLTIGSIPAMAQYRVTDVLARFTKSNHHMTLDIIQAGSEQLMDMLRQEQCDVAFIRESDPVSDDIVRIPYTTDHLVAVLPESHPLAECEHITLSELKDENFILLEKTTMIYNLCVSACRTSGFEPKVVFSDHKLENIIEMVVNEMGVSLLMNQLVQYGGFFKIAVIDVEPELKTQINLCYLKKRALSDAAKQFIYCVEMR